MKEKYQRFIEVLNQHDNMCCETCPIYKECQQMLDAQSDNPLYCCEDLLFAYVEQGKDFKNILNILVNKMYYIDFVSWQNPQHHYAPRAGLFSTREEAQEWADEWNRKMEWIDDRKAVVEEYKEDY